MGEPERTKPGPDIALALTEADSGRCALLFSGSTDHGQDSRRTPPRDAEPCTQTGGGGVESTWVDLAVEGQTPDEVAPRTIVQRPPRGTHSFRAPRETRYDNPSQEGWKRT